MSGYLKRSVKDIKIKIPYTKYEINIGSAIKKDIDVDDPSFVPFSFGGYDSTKLGDTAEQLSAYRGWTGDCVSLIAERIASIPLRLYDKNNEVITEHPFLELMKYWNPDTTQFMGKETTSIYLDLAGECYIKMLRNRLGFPQELHFISPTVMTPIVKDGMIDHYEEKINFNTVIRHEKVDILFFRYPSPTNKWRGASPIQRKAYAYDTDKYNMVYQLNMFKNGVHLKQVLETDQNMDTKETKRILALFDQTYGGIDKAHKTGALVGGMKLKTVGVSNKDMEFMTLANWTMRQLASTYHTPPQKLSHPESTNLANMTALDVAWNRECILPRLVRQEEIYNTFLIPFYRSAGLHCKFDNPVPEDVEFSLKRRDSNIKNHVISPNEARLAEGLEPALWGELPLVANNVAPLILVKDVKDVKDVKEKEVKHVDVKKVTLIKVVDKKDECRKVIKLLQAQEILLMKVLREEQSIKVLDGIASDAISQELIKELTPSLQEGLDLKETSNVLVKRIKDIYSKYKNLERIEEILYGKGVDK